MLCQTRNGKWLPFDLETVPAAPDTVDGYLPLRSPGTVVLVPVTDVAPRHLANIRWLARRHRCAEFLRWLAERREHVDGFADIAAAIFIPPETRTDEQDPR